MRTEDILYYIVCKDDRGNTLYFDIKYVRQGSGYTSWQGTSRILVKTRTLLHEWLHSAAVFRANDYGNGRVRRKPLRVYSRKEFIDIKRKLVLYPLTKDTLPEVSS